MAYHNPYYGGWGRGGWGWYNQGTFLFRYFFSAQRSRYLNSTTPDWGDAPVHDVRGNKEEAECGEGFACMVIRCCCFEMGMNTCAWCGDDDFCVTRLCCVRAELDEKSYIFQCLCCKVTKHTNETTAGRVNGLFQCVGWPECSQIRCFCCVAKYDKCLFCGDDDLCRIRCCCLHTEIDNRVERCQIFCIKCPMQKN